MIDIHIRFTNGQEMFRTVWRIDYDRDSSSLVIFDTYDQKVPERVTNAVVRIYFSGQLESTHKV